MTSAVAPKSSPDFANSVPVIIGSPLLSLVALLMCQAAEVNEGLTQAITAVVLPMPIAALTIRHRLRTTARQRAVAIAADDLAVKPFAVAISLGSFLVLVDSALG